MSSMEAHTGRLVEIEMYCHMTIEAYLEHIFTQEKGITDLNHWKNWSDYAVGESGEYYIHDDKLYKIKNHMSMTDDEPGVAKRDANGDIEFTLQFYNGGSDLDESLGDALDKLKEEEK